MTKNILSIDLESWIHFYKSALSPKNFGLTSHDRKILDDGYTNIATSKILSLLEKYNQKATFFVVGELYDWYPEVIEEIKKMGHEIGYHTHNHPILYNGQILEGEIKQSRNFINRFKPIGFRAPQIYITPDSMLYLKKSGFKYSSSTYDDYKIRDISGIDEIPVSAISFRKKSNEELPKNLKLKMLFKQIPFGSGLFISILGSKTSYFINYLNRRDIPAILFIHPWQVHMPKKLNSIYFKMRILFNRPLCLPYTINVFKTMEKLLKNHEFTSFKEYYYK